MRQETENWLQLAANDYDDSLYLYQAARHPNAVYLICQAVEKLLKATITEIAQEVPPKTHHLAKLAQQSQLAIPAEQLVELKELNRHYRRIRYRDIAQADYNTRTKVEPIMASAQTLYTWILATFNNQ